MDGRIMSITIPGWSGFLYLPPGYEEEADRRYSAAYLNAGKGMREELAGILEPLEKEFTKGLEPFLLVVNEAENWNASYTPWPAEPLFGGEALEGRADEWLGFLTQVLKPYMDEHYRTKADPGHTAIMGYSLGGLASLYAIYRCSCFGLAASLSGSLWYDGFTDFMKENRPKRGEIRLYLSLGRKEGKSRNPRLRRVAGATTEAVEILSGQLTQPPRFVWNEGGHFDGVKERWQEAFRYLFGREEEKTLHEAEDRCADSGEYAGGIVDSHAHYDDKAFDEDRETLLLSLAANGITEVVNVGASLESTRRSLELAQSYPFVYAAVGVHPSETTELTQENFEEIVRAAKHPKAVAIGEIGLDYYWDSAPRETQKYWFKRQMELAVEEGMPVIIHSRDAAQDTFEMIREASVAAAARGRRLYGVVHCFSYSAELAREYRRLGFYIGLGGTLTFKNSRKPKEVAEDTPLESILLETDCPYLAPVPYRGRRNSSLYLPYVAEELARLKGTDTDTVIRVTRENAYKMYGICSQPKKDGTANEPAQK